MTVRKRTAHGRAAELGATIVYETTSDPVRPAPEGAAAPVERREDGTVTPQGAAELARMRWEAAKIPNFAERELEYVPAAEFAVFDQGRRELTERRRRELHEATGGVSSAVGATIRGEAWLTAFAEFWATQAATTGDPEAADRAMRFFKAASTERVKAWDAACVEAKSRQDADRDDLVSQQRAFQRQLAARQGGTGG